MFLASTLAGADSSAIMERLKALEGEWMWIDEQGEVTDQVASEFRLTANGSALREFMFPGEPHEMLNVFHQDGERMLMTHYCAAGSQPRLEVVEDQDSGDLLLQFDSITNLPTPETHFMHHAEYSFEGQDRLRTTWYASTNGEILEETTVIYAERRK